MTQVLSPAHPGSIRAKGRRLHPRWLFLFILAGFLLIGRAIPAAVPGGFSAAEWDSIRAQMAAAEYQFTPAGAAWAAPNRAQGWQVQFGPDGAQVAAANGSFDAAQDKDWTWGLTLTGYGYGQEMHRPGDPASLTADKETVTYQWHGLSEWWVNSPAGLEQGFTVRQRPVNGNRYSVNGNPLVLEMAVSGSLTPALDGGDILFRDAGGETILRYDRLHVVDAAGQTIPARLELAHSPFTIHHSPPVLSKAEGFTIRILVADEHATYPLTIDPWLQAAKLAAADAQANDFFGFAVAISGDTAVIGAYQEDGGAGDPLADAGAAYVFERDQGGAGA